MSQDKVISPTEPDWEALGYEEKPAERTMSFEDWCKVPPCRTEVFACEPRNLITSCQICQAKYASGEAQKHLYFSYENGLKGLVTRIYKESKNV
jgi:hypothetical protein